MNTTFSKNLKFLRKRLNLKQEHISKMLNIARNTYSHYETAKNEPSYDILIKLSKIFGCSIDYLLTNTDNELDNYKNENFSIEPTIKYLESQKKLCEIKLNKVTEELTSEMNELDNLIKILESMR
ncbi:helix-turn-helix domain-containing protein [Acinetobacter baumannii]|nr:helix-turn-helix domain-containing protein [Acinetobacter baumannii]